MSISASLFEPPDESILGGVADWLTALLAGTAATTLCVIAVALLGLWMLSGRMPIRRGAEVILGCFLLLGATTIALGLRGVGDGLMESREPVPLVIERAAPPPLPPANYDPYAGASLRRRNIIDQER